MGVCNCYMFCCTLLYVYSSIAIILMGKRELVALLNLSSWCLVMVERFFLAVPWGCLRFVIVVFPDHTHLLFLNKTMRMKVFLTTQFWTIWMRGNKDKEIKETLFVLYFLFALYIFQSHLSVSYINSDFLIETNITY